MNETLTWTTRNDTNYTNYTNSTTVSGPSSLWSFSSTTAAATEASNSNRKIPYSLDIFFFIITLLFSFASVIGNIFLIWCFFRYLRRKLSKCFVIYISIMASDMIQGLFSMPFTALIFLQTHNIPESWKGSRWFEDMCNVSGFIYNTVSRVAVHLLFLLTLDRFLAVYQPQIHRNRTSRNLYTIIIGFIWFLDLTISTVPYFHGQTYRFRYNSKMDSTCIFSIMDISTVLDDDKKVIYDATFKHLLWWYMGSITLPATLFLVFTIILSFMLLKRLLSQMSNSQRGSKRVYVYASNTILLISLVYFICYFNWNVLQIFGIVQAVAGVVCGHNTVILLTNFYLKNDVLSAFAANSCLPIFANSAINPIILYFRVVRNEMKGSGRGSGGTENTQDTLYSSFKRKLRLCNTRLTETLFNVKPRSENVEYSKLPAAGNHTISPDTGITEVTNDIISYTKSQPV